MSTWFQVLAVGNQQVAISLPRMHEFPLISAIKSFFFPSNKVVRRASAATETLNPVCKDLNNTEEKPATDLS
ncbi:MAG TPA: hypothetical protein V6D26_19950 [Stenomitos sp.]